MNEVEWVNQVAAQLSKEPWLLDDGVAVKTGLKLAYGSEIIRPLSRR